jgi:hypothetical protein
VLTHRLATTECRRACCESVDCTFIIDKGGNRGAQ